MEPSNWGPARGKVSRCPRRFVQNRIVVELFCDADSQCAQAELLLKTIFSIIGDLTLQVRVLDVNVTFALYQDRRLL
jgi:hypothetical protein